MDKHTRKSPPAVKHKERPVPPAPPGAKTARSPTSAQLAKAKLSAMLLELRRGAGIRPSPEPTHQILEETRKLAERPGIFRGPLDFVPMPEADKSSYEAAIHYLQQGLRPVPLRAAGETITRANGKAIVATGKEPIGTGWGRTVHTPESLKVALEANPERGVGLVLGLGPDGADGVFDLEIDDPDEAQDTLGRIFRDRVPETLAWSSLRGRHRLFQLTVADAAKLRDLGIPSVVNGKAHRAYAGIELRFGTLDPADPKEVQSAAPPTSYPCRDGVVATRKWEGGSVAPFPWQLMMDLVASFTRSTKRAEPPPRPEDPDLTPVAMFEHQLGAMGLTVVHGDDGYTAQCPVHNDRTPSLSFREGDHGELLVFCHACGALFDEIMAAVGLEPSDGFVREDDWGLQRPTWRTNMSVSGCAVRRPFTQSDYQKWEGLAHECETALRLRARELSRLAERLGVSEESLRRLHVGWRARNRRKDSQTDEWLDDGPAWTFAEVDAEGRITGIMRRFVDQTLEKKVITGSRRGLVVPEGFADQPGPILVVEGASDVAALLTIGKTAVGRPNNGGGVALLADLLRDDPREVIVVGEHDQKPDGSWPGDPAPVARALATRLGRPVKQMLPPPGHKDMRAYIVATQAGGHDVAE